MGQLVPLMYCLLSKKTKVMYRNLFETIKNLTESKGLSVAVEFIDVIFEDAAIKGFFDVFPDAGIECCFFQLAQSH